MSGKRLSAPRSGDRSEYMSHYGLSRFAFVSPVPRQEDFGVIDFFCVLTERRGKCDYPRSAFFVQVKSSNDDIILDEDAVKWVSFHMDHPLFICVCDKEKQDLSFYSCSRLWLLLFLRHEVKEIRLKLDSDGPDGHILPIGELPILPESAYVFLGQAILNQNLSDIEADPSVAFKVLDKWIQMDVDNIARRRLGRVAVRYFENWLPNKAPDENDVKEYYFSLGKYEKMETELIRFLMALKTTYEKSKQNEKLSAAWEMLKVLQRERNA